MEKNKQKECKVVYQQMSEAQEITENSGIISSHLYIWLCPEVVMEEFMSWQRHVCLFRIHWRSKIVEPHAFFSYFSRHVRYIMYWMGFGFMIDGWCMCLRPIGLKLLWTTNLMNELPVIGYPCYAQRTLGSPSGKHCKSLEGNVWRKVVSTSKKRILERD